MANKYFSKIPLFAQDPIVHSNKTLDEYQWQARKNVCGKGSFTFGQSELTDSLQAAQKAIEVVESMLKAVEAVERSEGGRRSRSGCELVSDFACDKSQC